MVAPITCASVHGGEVTMMTFMIGMALLCGLLDSVAREMREGARRDLLSLERIPIRTDGNRLND